MWASIAMNRNSNRNSSSGGSIASSSIDSAFSFYCASEETSCSSIVTAYDRSSSSSSSSQASSLWTSITNDANDVPYETLKSRPSSPLTMDGTTTSRSTSTTTTSINVHMNTLDDLWKTRRLLVDYSKPPSCSRATSPTTSTSSHQNRQASMQLSGHSQVTASKPLLTASSHHSHCRRPPQSRLGLSTFRNNCTYGWDPSKTQPKYFRMRAMERKHHVQALELALSGSHTSTKDDFSPLVFLPMDDDHDENENDENENDQDSAATSTGALVAFQIKKRNRATTTAIFGASSSSSFTRPSLRRHHSGSSASTTTTLKVLMKQSRREKLLEMLHNDDALCLLNTSPLNDSFRCVSTGDAHPSQAKHQHRRASASAAATNVVTSQVAASFHDSWRSRKTIGTPTTEGSSKRTSTTTRRLRRSITARPNKSRSLRDVRVDTLLKRNASIKKSVPRSFSAHTSMILSRSKHASYVAALQAIATGGSSSSDDDGEAAESNGIPLTITIFHKPSGNHTSEIPMTRLAQSKSCPIVPRQESSSVNHPTTAAPFVSHLPGDDEDNEDERKQAFRRPILVKAMSCRPRVTYLQQNRSSHCGLSKQSRRPLTTMATAHPRQHHQQESATSTTHDTVSAMTAWSSYRSERTWKSLLDDDDDDDGGDFNCCQKRDNVISSTTTRKQTVLEHGNRHEDGTDNNHSSNDCDSNSSSNKAVPPSINRRAFMVRRSSLLGGSRIRTFRN